MKLRSYQNSVVAGALGAWRNGYRRIAAVLATGGGKTVVFSHVAEMSLAAGHPVLVLAHRTELIDQAIDKLRQVAPSRRIGRMQGRDKQYQAEIVVGSVQTCATDTSLALLVSRTWGLIIIDETHHATASTYVKILNELRAFDEGGPLVLGVTATLDRSDGAALGQIFEHVVEPQYGLIDLIKHPEGPFLVPPRGIRVRIAELNLDKIKRVAGDFNSGALGRAMSEALAPKRIVEAYLEHAESVPALAFLPTVAISIEQADAFNAAGIPAMHLDGTTPAPARAEALEAFRRGDLTVLCNVSLFTEGTDLPNVGCILMARPTSSRTLYQQIIGRGLRLHPNKKFCWVIDFTGVTSRHTLATLVSLNGADTPEDTPDDLLMYEDDETSENVLGEADSSTGAGEADPIAYADGDLAHQFVDLFGESHTAWLRTPGGRWFAPAGSQGFVFLVPAMSGHADRYDVRWTTHERGHEGLIQADMEIGYAMAAGDEFVASRPMWQAERDAPWRKHKHRSGRTRGEVHDDEMIVRAGRLFDLQPIERFIR